jgi:hypothetical protein
MNSTVCQYNSTEKPLTSQWLQIKANMYYTPTKSHGQTANWHHQVSSTPLANGQNFFWLDFSSVICWGKTRKQQELDQKFHRKLRGS